MGNFYLKPFLHFSEVKSAGEEGLMGMTPDPDYQFNKLLYVCLAYSNGKGGYTDKVISLKDNGSSASVEKTLIDGIPLCIKSCRMQNQIRA